MLSIMSLNYKLYSKNMQPILVLRSTSNYQPRDIAVMDENNIDGMDLVRYQ